MFLMLAKWNQTWLSSSTQDNNLDEENFSRVLCPAFFMFENYFSIDLSLCNIGFALLF